MKILTASEFLSICEIVGGPDRAVEILNPKAWPDFRETGEVAEDAAMDLDLVAISEWCQRRVK